MRLMEGDMMPDIRSAGSAGAEIVGSVCQI